MIVMLYGEGLERMMNFQLLMQDTIKVRYKYLLNLTLTRGRGQVIKVFIDMKNIVFSGYDLFI